MFFNQLQLLFYQLHFIFHFHYFTNFNSIQLFLNFFKVENHLFHTKMYCLKRHFKMHFKKRISIK